MPIVESLCRTHVKVDKLSHRFLINNARYRAGEMGEAIESCSFPSSGEIQWRLKVYLNGKDEEYKDCIGLFLKLESTGKIVHAKYSFSVVNLKQEKKHKWVSSITAFVQGTDIGCPDFLKRDFLFDEAHWLLMNDELAICCDVDVVSDIITGQTIPVKLVVPESSLSDDFGKLFESRKYSDVIISVEGRELSAHKNVLSVRSSVFAAMFELEMDKTVVYSITNLTYESVKEMLNFIYTGKVHNIRGNAFNLLAAANWYALDRLKVMCEESLSLNLSCKNASHVLMVADDLNDNQLKAHAVNFISLHAADVMGATGWKRVENLYHHLLTEIYATSAVPINKTMCQNQVEVTEYSYTWVIDNFSFCVQKKIESSIFLSGVKDEEKWCLELYPNGYGDLHKGYVSVYLKLVSYSKSKVATKFYFLILDDSLEAVSSATCDNVIIFDKDKKVKGIDKFYNRTLLLDESNDLLTNDRLILRCNLNVFSEPVNISAPNHAVQFRVPACKLSDDLEKLFANHKFSDVIFSVNGHELYAHKNVLSTRSPVFAAMFQREMGTAKHNTVQITDVDYEVFKEMLCFIYTGNVPNVEGYAVELLVAAIKYALERLKAMCESALFSNLSINNACDFLILADEHGADELKVRVIDFINSHVDAVVHSSSWKTLEKHHAHLIVELCRLLHAQKDLLKQAE